MSTAGGRPPLEAACPFLGLYDDPSTRFAFAAAAHRCRADGRPRSVELGHQGAFCLAAAYPACPRYHAEAAPQPGVPTRPVVPAGSTGGTPRRRRVAVAVLAVAVVAVVVGVGLAAGAVLPDLLQRGASTLPGSGPPASVLAPSSAASATPEPTASPTASPTATPSASPMPSPTPLPTPSATPSPSPAPSASARPSPTPRYHVVRLGETLTGIAARYGVTIQAIQKANKITNPSLIRVGQRLVIPPP